MVNWYLRTNRLNIGRALKEHVQKCFTNFDANKCYVITAGMSRLVRDVLHLLVWPVGVSTAHGMAHPFRQVRWGFDDRTEYDARRHGYSVRRTLLLHERQVGPSVLITNDDLSVVFSTGHSVVFLMEIEGYRVLNDGSCEILTCGKTRERVTRAREKLRQRGVHAEIVFIGGDYKRYVNAFVDGLEPSTHLYDFEIWTNSDLTRSLPNHQDTSRRRRRFLAPRTPRWRIAMHSLRFASRRPGKPTK
jgi:hypothetical protein